MIATPSGIFLHGGWNGKSELGDFWLLRDGKWHMLCQDTSEFGGPSPRSCHSMAYDSTRNNIYLTGRYDSLPGPNDFFSYNIDTHTWTVISWDTKLDMGPGHIFESQMVYEPHTDSLYVFGGKQVEQMTLSYCGLMRYDLQS